VEAFRPKRERGEEAYGVRGHYGLEDEPVVLYAGTIRESKGVGVLLDSMDRVRDRHPRAVLVLVGGTEFGRGRLHRETPFFKQFREQAARATGRIIFTGFVPHENMALTYLLGDIFVAPSQKEEGMPMVLLEASACGLPLVATRLGGIPEVVQGSQARETAQEQFSWSHIAQKQETVYDEVLQEKISRKLQRLNKGGN